MPERGKLIAICQFGGRFTDEDDGTLVYSNGDAHAISVERIMKYEELIEELEEMWKLPMGYSIKYFLPDNRKTLINLSSDKDIERMIDSHEDSNTIEIFVVSDDSRSPEVMRRAVFDPASPNEIEVYNGEQKLRWQWGNSITGLHQQFNSVEEVRDAIRKYSIARGFSYVFKNNDGTRVSAKCKTEGCQWRIYVSRLSTTPLFRTKKFVGAHTCGAGGANSVLRPHASRKLVASIMKEKLRDSPSFKPKEIADQIQREFGIELRYSQAWRGMETAKEELHGAYKEAYGHLPWLCEKILETNPGSFVSLSTLPGESFHRLFVAFHASVSGFLTGCRPLVFLDSLPVKSKYQTELVTATAIDGNDGIFPLAFAIVEGLNENDWYWFLTELKTAVRDSQPITFVAKRHLKQCVTTVFQDSFHTYCLAHLTAELKENLMSGPSPARITEESCDAIVGYLNDAALAPTLDGFKKNMVNIRNINPEANDWLSGQETESWANSLLKGARCNHLVSGISRNFFEWVTGSQMLPVTQIIDIIRQKMMEMMYVRRVESDQWVSKLTPVGEKTLRERTEKAQALEAVFSAAAPVEVRDCLGGTHFIHVEERGCTCREWQLSGVPCVHAIAALRKRGSDVYDYCSRCYTTERFRMTYAQPINPVTTSEKYGVEGSHVRVNPPAVSRVAGPPKKRRDRSKGKVKRPLHCSMCKAVGHNRATCSVHQ